MNKLPIVFSIADISGKSIVLFPCQTRLGTSTTVSDKSELNRTYIDLDNLNTYIIGTAVSNCCNCEFPQGYITAINTITSDCKLSNNNDDIPDDYQLIVCNTYTIDLILDSWFLVSGRTGCYVQAVQQNDYVNQYKYDISCQLKEVTPDFTSPSSS